MSRNGVARNDAVTQDADVPGLLDDEEARRAVAGATISTGAATPARDELARARARRGERAGARRSLRPLPRTTSGATGP